MVKMYRVTVGSRVGESTWMTGLRIPSLLQPVIKGKILDGFIELLIRKRALVNQKAGNLTVEGFLARVLNRIALLADRHLGRIGVRLDRKHPSTDQVGGVDKQLHFHRAGSRCQASCGDVILSGFQLAAQPC